MSTPDSDSIVESGFPTEEVRMNDTSQVPAISKSGSADSSSDLDSLFADEQDEWPTQGPAKGVRMPWLAAVLSILLVASVGIWGGAYMQRHSSSSTTSTASAFPFAALSGSHGSGASGESGLSAALANITSGTVTDIIGSTLYVTNASGNLVAVQVGSNTTIDRNAKSSLSAIQPGDTVTVQGTKSSSGSVAAASVSATQSGVSTTGGLGGFGGFGGAGSGASRGSAG
jgi:hypothetical protein